MHMAKEKRLPDLIVKSRPTPDETGCVLHVTPQAVGWTHVGFAVYRLAEGQILHYDTADREACLVFVSGRGAVRAGRMAWPEVGQRMNPFDGTPHAVYVPPQTAVRLEAITAVEVAVCTAPGRGTYPPRLIGPDDVAVEVRGAGVTERCVRHILSETAPADGLLVVEVITPAGRWSSWPPHKHDRHDPPCETALEETYYYRIRPQQGFAIQRVYTADGVLDATLTVRDGETVLVPRGYHPVAAPPGYDVYYLNVMAGPVRQWRIQFDPEHEWQR